ncbi:MAG TPA: ABC transporter ATP-binding protein [Gammaproteobacteria bacterium]|jgi:branched-chain amino acid transport system ATP-binding protein|nr:MAG: ABC transporter ATP-binding protein [Acidithiobacillus sp.]HAD37443.1 ABC transporter ATP-binding protein [Gammaproteobacteria bacterium]HBK77023.1 ABC transporter ATP-binding protein [Gammaproteobacteria bacterium]HIM88659.1 ABC transporter ATP-binding protein [Gammaproteobacteria bacterium]HIN42359.1 ABC transporter ATP-binding protein [Gammaproteobacteria bacterium]
MRGCVRSISEKSIVASSGLSLVSVSAGYGETVALENIDLEILAGEAVSVIGRNGVGKSTLLMTIMGHTDLHSGSVHLNGKEITAAKPCQRVWNGLGLVPQERLIFPSLTVDENLAVAVRAGSWTSTRVYSMFPQLDARRQNLGNQLSGGEQQMLAIGRALVGNPKVLLMDEPSEGLAPVIVEELQSVINRLREESSMTIILVEQNSRVALEFSERCIVMNRGRVVRDGSSEALRQDQTLLERLIGVDSSLL